MKYLISLLALSIISILFGQTKNYYLFPDGQVFSQPIYEAFKNNDKLRKEITFSIIDSINRNDSLIYTVDIKSKNINYDSISKSENNPYSKFDKYIGTNFMYNKFADSEHILESVKNSKKPTVINFWFTNCGPCIAEFNYLNELKSKFSNSVNFVAITFDSKEKVEKLLQSKPFYFEQVTNQREGIDAYEITSYPLTFILNSKSEIIDIKGDIYNYKIETEELLNKLL